MIAKNEAHDIRDCLESVRDIVDEIILVDTGSTDDTVKIAKEYGAKITKLGWQDDFAAARNESLRHASGDWILYLDADEKLSPESKSELKRWIHDDAAACVNVLIESPIDDKQHHISRAHRLFRNLPGVRFRGRIHEQIFPAFAGHGYAESFSSIKILHSGYAKSKSEMAEKNLRNYALLKKQLEDEPDNPYWHFSLAQNLMLSSKFEDARKHLNTALSLGGLPHDLQCTIHNNLADICIKTGELKEATPHLDRAAHLNPNQSTTDLLRYRLYFRKGDRPGQLCSLEAALGKTKRRQIDHRKIAIEVGIDICTMHRTLGRLYAETQEFKKAARAFEEALTYRPDDQGILTELALAHIKSKDFYQAIRTFEHLLKIEKHPVIERRLAGLYHKIGESEKAVHLLRG